MECAYYCGRDAVSKFGLCASCQAQLSADAREAIADLNHRGDSPEAKATRQLGAVRAVQLVREQSKLMDYVLRAHGIQPDQPQHFNKPPEPTSGVLGIMEEN